MSLLQSSSSDIIEINEGKTKILVPTGSLKEKVPPKKPAFFNPKAKGNRDVSIIAYSSFLENFDGPKIFLEGLSGLGARGLRVANEVGEIEKVVVNDLNPEALILAKKSAQLNELNNVEFSENEICRFLSTYSKKGERGTIVDIDPFGSPAKYIDCGIRATMHGGMLSVSATDLQVLNGLFQKACKRRYGGKAIKTHYGNEIALRLILGMIGAVGGRLDIEIIPLYVESDMHYYRVYVKVLNRPDQKENLGFIFHCKFCGNRGILEDQRNCDICNSKLDVAGPLWIGKIFQKEFVRKMIQNSDSVTLDTYSIRNIKKCFLEAEGPPTYFTLDEIASRMKKSPLKLEAVISLLQENGYFASPTSLDPTGFRTDAKIKEIFRIFSH